MFDDGWSFDLSGTIHVETRAITAQICADFKLSRRRFIYISVNLHDNFLFCRCQSTWWITFGNYVARVESNIGPRGHDVENNKKWTAVQSAVTWDQGRFIRG